MSRADPFKFVPSRSPRCPTCDAPMEFVSFTPTCQSVIYGYICVNDGDRLNWECRRQDATRTPPGDAIGFPILSNFEQISSAARNTIAQPVRDEDTKTIQPE